MRTVINLAGLRQIERRYLELQVLAANKLCWQYQTVQASFAWCVCFLTAC